MDTLSCSSGRVTGLRFEQMLKAKGGTEFILQDPGMKKMHRGCRGLGTQCQVYCNVSLVLQKLSEGLTPLEKLEPHPFVQIG